jgi:hypothetical protein
MLPLDRLGSLLEQVSRIHALAREVTPNP